MTKEEIKKKILEYAEKDQKIRQHIFSAGYKPTPEDWKELADIDLETTNFMKKVVGDEGLPTLSHYGKTAENYAWMLVQHSADLEFQKTYLHLLKTANQKDIQLEHIAYLEDRILWKEKKAQIFGTQAITDKETGKPVPYNLQDAKNVNNLRASVGLESLEDYLASF